jgi:anti-sigma B factor antagonist
MERPPVVVGHKPIRDHPDAVLVTVEGSVDPKTVNRFKTDLEAIAKTGIRRFVLDCARLTYLNSSGLAYLLNLVGSLPLKGGMVALVAVDPKILVIFNMMGITQLFRLYPSVSLAVREMDEKLARELRDVGPAIPLVDEPPPAHASSSKLGRPAPAAKSSPRRDRTTRRIRLARPAPSGGPISRFFRRLFGLEERRPGRATGVRRR